MNAWNSKWKCDKLVSPAVLSIASFDNNVKFLSRIVYRMNLTNFFQINCIARDFQRLRHSISKTEAFVCQWIMCIAHKWKAIDLELR